MIYNFGWTFDFGSLCVLYLAQAVENLNNDTLTVLQLH